MSMLLVSMIGDTRGTQGHAGTRRDIRLAPAVCSMFATKRALMGALD
jgi:hypothetical protein